jgi:transcriptional regulator
VGADLCRVHALSPGATSAFPGHAAAFVACLSSTDYMSAMYLPDHFRADDVAQMHALMRAHPLAALVSAGPGGLYGSHLPTVLNDESGLGAIECHLARANPHCKELAAVREALMIFQGPEGYITPNWYATKVETGKVVPTWNYAVVHA